MSDGKGRRLPDSMREELSHPFGPIIDIKLITEKKADVPLLTVGDVVSLTARKADVVPTLVIYDGQTERRGMSDFSLLVEGEGGPDRTVGNPAGTVTAELMEAIEESLAEGGPSSIRVEGEEDLAVLACILLAPIGSWVVYGQPGEGMVLVVKDEDSLRRTKELWNRMEELE